MFKKVVAYQKLFLNSVPSVYQNINNSPSKTIATIAFYAFALFMLARLMEGAYMPVALSLGSIWMINRNFNGDQPLFDLVPVSRRFIVFNTYLAAIFIIIAAFFTMWLMGLALFGIILGGVYIFSPESIVPDGFNRTSADTLNTFQGDMFMLFVLIIILFVGITIIFIRNKRYRNRAFTGMFAAIYVALSFLKSIMPAAPVSDQASFMENLSVMPQINELLMGTGIAMLLMVPLSIYVGYRLYMTPDFR